MRLIALYTVMPANNVNGAEICVICSTNACFFPFCFISNGMQLFFCTEEGCY